MTAQTNAKRAKLILATVSGEDVSECAKATAKAIVTFEKAKVSLLQTIAKAVDGFNIPSLSAKQYDKQFAPSFDAAMAAAVKRNAITEGTAKNYRSRIKTAVLAILNDVASPLAGETFSDFYTRAGEALGSAKLPNGEHVWEGKTGRPRAAKGSKPAVNNVVAGANSAGDASREEGGTNVAAVTAAARIFCGGENVAALRLEERRAKLLVILQDFADDFDKWAESVIPATDKKSRKAA